MLLIASDSKERDATLKSMRRIYILLLVIALAPIVSYAEVPEEYREEIRAVLLSGTIAPEIEESEFEAFVDALSNKAFDANITGADITSARVEALLGAAAGFDAPQTSEGRVREPQVGVLWGTVALLLLMMIIGRYYRRLHQGGALGHP